MAGLITKTDWLSDRGTSMLGFSVKKLTGIKVSPIISIGITGKSF